ncbi:MAG: DUF6268 family outer membrane beta-barrel protein [Chitinophagales bacterium]
MKSAMTYIRQMSFLLLIFSSAESQPYIDLINVRYIGSPGNNSTSKEKNATTLNYLSVSATLPFQFKNKKDAIILTPFFERWESQVNSRDNYSPYHYGLVLPIAFLKSIPDSRWSILTMPIVRMNDAVIDTKSSWQFGGALIASYKKNDQLTYKFGAYVNGEFFGLFLIPLVGIDWKINDRNNLFGVLPASLTFEHKLNNHFYSGAVFRTFTNSYRDYDPNYWRVDENQLGIFLDSYLGSHFVLNLELGHSLFRKIRSGEKYEVNDNWNAEDGFYFKFGIAYRIRFR